MRNPQETARLRRKNKVQSCTFQKEQDTYFLRVDTRNYLRSLRLEGHNSASWDKKDAPGMWQVPEIS